MPVAQHDDDDDDDSYLIQIIFKQIYLTHRWDPNRNYYSGLVNWGKIVKNLQK